MSIPIIYVTNTSHSTSFYNNVCTPLGIVYLTTTSTNGASQHHFGIAGNPSETLFTLQESSRPRASTITLTASNATQVTKFHTLALDSQAGRGTNLISQTDNGAVAKTTDLDGNLLEVRYERRARRGSNGGSSIRSSHAPRLQRQNSSESHRESTTITTASTAKEAKRVLEWQRTVARSVPESSEVSEGGLGAVAIRKSQPAAETVVSSSTLIERRAPPSAAPSAPSLLSQHFQQQQAQAIEHAIPSLMRSVTEPVGAIRDLCKEISSHMPPSTTDSNGLSNNGLIGTILGAAAGAAIAYAMVKSEEPEKRPDLVTHFTAPAYTPQPQIGYQQQQMPARSLSLSEQGMMQPMGHDYGYNVLQAMRSHLTPQPIYTEPAQSSSQSPSGIEVGSQARSKAPSAIPSDYHAFKSGSRSEALRHRTDGGNSQSGSRVGSLRDSTLIQQAEQYSSSPKSTHSHHSSRSKAEGSYVSKSSSKQTTKPEPARADTVVSKHSTGKSSASSSRGSEASTIKPSKSSSKSAVSKAPTAVVSEAKSSHTSHSRSGEKDHGIGSVHSVRSEKSKHSKVPRSEISYAGTVVPEDSVSQIGSRYSSSRRRQEVY